MVRFTGQVKPTSEPTKIEITIPSWQVDQLQTLDIDKKYIVEIKEFKNKRSLEQNNLMWGLIDKINKAENGFKATKDSEMDIYINLIKMAQIKRDIVATVEDSIPQFEAIYRAVEQKGKVEVNGVELVRLVLYKGTSHFNTKEMTDFIEALLSYAQEVGVDTSEYQ